MCVFVCIILSPLPRGYPEGLCPVDHSRWKWSTRNGKYAKSIPSPLFLGFSTVVCIRAESGVHAEFFLHTDMLRAPGSQNCRLTNTWHHEIPIYFFNLDAWPKRAAFLWVTAWVQESKSEAPAPSESSSDAGRVKTVDARHA